MPVKDCKWQYMAKYAGNDYEWLEMAEIGRIRLKIIRKGLGLAGMTVYDMHSLNGWKWKARIETSIKCCKYQEMSVSENNGYLMMMMKMTIMVGENRVGSLIHNCFGPPFLSVGGLLSTGATLSGFYLFVELGYYYILFQHICAENYTNSILKETSIHV